jgi:hypothetical protein
MRLVIRGAVTRNIHIMHVQNKTLGTCGRIGPLDCRRCAFARSRAFGSLTEPYRNLTAVGKARYGHRHYGWSRRASALACGHVAALSTTAPSTRVLSQGKRKPNMDHYQRKEKKSNQAHLSLSVSLSVFPVYPRSCSGRIGSL